MDNILNNLYIEVNNNNNDKIIFLFLIGSYPNYSKLHEMPPFIKNYYNDYKIYIILIDPVYTNNDIINISDITFTKNNNSDFYNSFNNIKLLIHNKLINKYDYGKILGFCNYYSNYYNNLFFIFEYTSIIRPNYKTFLKNTNPSNTWISYSDCMADMNLGIYNPIIENNMIYDITIHSNLYEEYKYTKQLNNNNSKKKCEYIFSSIVKFLNDIEILLSMRSYAKIKVYYHNEQKKELYYNKTINWNEDRKYLLYRLLGSYNCIHENILNDFENSIYNDLLLYIDSIINNFFMNIYMILNIDNYFENNNLTFETNEDCRKNIEFYKNKLGEYDIPKDVSVI